MNASYLANRLGLLPAQRGTGRVHGSGFNRSRSRRSLERQADYLTAQLGSLELKECERPEKRLVPEVGFDEDMRERGEDRKRKWRLRQKAEESLETISLDQVSWHDTPDDCWIVIYDYVYDCTKFLDSHPGGRDVLAEYAGRDATLAFIGTGHSKAASKSLEKYLIGELPVEERIFRVQGGLNVLGI